MIWAARVPLEAGLTSESSYSGLRLRLNIACYVWLPRTCADFARDRDIFKETSCRGNFEMSCEPGRKSAYSSDLRYRIIWQRIAMKLSVRKVAHNYNLTSVDLTTLSSPEWFTQILYARNVQTQVQSTVRKGP